MADSGWRMADGDDGEEHCRHHRGLHLPESRQNSQDDQLHHQCQPTDLPQELGLPRDLIGCQGQTRSDRHADPDVEGRRFEAKHHRATDDRRGGDVQRTQPYQDTAVPTSILRSA